VRRFGGANIDTDHYLLMVWLRVWLFRMTDIRAIKTGSKYDNTLKIHEVKQEYIKKFVTCVNTTTNNYRNCR
jgi:hypothetical protein